MSPSWFLKKQETGQTYWLRGQGGRTNGNNPSSCLRPSYAAGMQIINEKKQNRHISWVGTPADLAAPCSGTEVAEKLKELHDVLERDDVEIGKETWIPLTVRCGRPNPKRQSSDTFPAVFARKPLGAPGWGRSVASWNSAAGWQMAGGVPDPAGPPLPAPRAGCQAQGSRRPSRLLPSGASETAEVETWLCPSACWPKGLRWHKGGSVLEGVCSQFLPAWEGMGRGDVFLSRALPASVCRYPLPTVAVLSDSSWPLGVIRPVVEHVSCSP